MLRNAFHINELFGTFWDRGKLGGQVEMSRFLSGPMDEVARQAKSAKFQVVSPAALEARERV
jgi:hypothetical protein